MSNTHCYCNSLPKPNRCDFCTGVRQPPDDTGWPAATLSCKCRIFCQEDGECWLESCPLHDSAADLFAVCEYALDNVGRSGANPIIRDMARAAIAKATSVVKS